VKRSPKEGKEKKKGGRGTLQSWHAGRNLPVYEKTKGKKFMLHTGIDKDKKRDREGERGTSPYDHHRRAKDTRCPVKITSTGPDSRKGVGEKYRDLSRNGGSRERGWKGPRA